MIDINFSAVSAAMIAKIPLAHLHGGEATEGLIDEPIRHNNNVSFTLYCYGRIQKRVIQLKALKLIFNDEVKYKKLKLLIKKILKNQ